MTKRYNIRDLAAKPKKVNLVHPVLGETDIWVEVVGPQSKQFRSALKAFEALPEAEQSTAEANLKFLSACVVGWDSEAFGEVHTPEAAERLFTEPENGWMVAFLTPIIQDHAKFFRAPD